MKIQDFKQFDKVIFNDQELIILDVFEKTTFYSKKEKIINYYLFYLVLTNESQTTGFVRKLCLTKDSVVSDWKLITNVKDDFECRLSTLGSNAKHKIKSKDKPFSEKDWSYFFSSFTNKEDSTVIFFDLNPNYYVRFDSFSTSIEKLIRNKINNWYAGFYFGYYKVNGKIVKIVTFNKKVYYLKNNGTLGVFDFLKPEKFFRKLKKTFYFSEEHALILANIITSTIKLK